MVNEINPTRLTNINKQALDAHNQRVVKGVELRPVLTQATPGARHPAGKARKNMSASKGHG